MAFLKIKHDIKSGRVWKYSTRAGCISVINRIVNQQHITVSAVATAIEEQKENGTEFFSIGIKRKLSLTEAIIH